MNKPKFIIIHHSLTKDGDSVSWDAIKKYHMETNGWSNIGYHFGVEKVGGEITFYIGRSESTEGSHCKELGMNKQSIGLCIVGNYDLITIPQEYLDVIIPMVKQMMQKYNIPASNVLGHREVGMLAGFDWKKNQFKSCPGSKVDMDKFRSLLN